MLSFQDAISQTGQFLDDFPSMQDKETCEAYVDSLRDMVPLDKAGDLGKSIWCNFLVENCKHQIQKMLNESELSDLQKHEWDQITKNLELAGSVYTNVIMCHIQHLKDLHKLNFYSHIENNQDKLAAVLLLSENVIKNLPDDGGNFEEIGQKGVLEIGNSILD